MSDLSAREAVAAGVRSLAVTIYDGHRDIRFASQVPCCTSSSCSGRGGGSNGGGGGGGGGH